MKRYESTIPTAMLLTRALAILVFLGGAVFVYARGDLTGSLVLFALGLVSTYWLLGYRNTLRVSSDKDGLYLRERSVLNPFGKPGLLSIPFDTIESFDIEHGPRSIYGPEVDGETVIVLKTTEGEYRIFGRWLKHPAYRELCDLLRSKQFPTPLK